MAQKKVTQIEIAPIRTETIKVPIVGTAPLIMHNFSAKARQQMLDSQQGKKAVKRMRDPEADYQEALYRTATGFGMPVTAFKNATVDAARYYDNSVTMKGLRQLLFFHGELSPDYQLLVPIIGEPRMREDVVRLSGPSRTADLRFRPEFVEWSAVLEIEYVISSLSFESVLSLVDAGGMGVGIGEWRPERKGENGTYAIDFEQPIERVAGGATANNAANRNAARLANARTRAMMDRSVAA